MRREVFFVLVACVLLPAAAGRADGPAGVLTLSSAIDIALKNQPSVRAGIYAVKAGEARIGEAKSAYYPQASGSTVFTRVSNPPSGGAAIATTIPGTSTLAPGTAAAAAFPGTFNVYTASVGASQLIYDFGRTGSQVRINTLTARSSRYDLAGTENTVALNVKQAYYAALQAGRDRAVAEETVSQLGKHVEQARSFFEIGTKTRFDVTQAEVNLSNAKLTLIQAENRVKLARLNLKQAMGLPDAPDYPLEDLLSYSPYGLTEEKALAAAYEHRPDLQSLVKKKEAAAQSVRLARAGYLPQLNANANYYYTGTDFPLQSGWSYGVNLSVPIFNGLITRYQVQEAEANYVVADANERTLRINITSQVRQGYLTLREASERIATSEVAVRQAKDNVDLATGRYRAGVGIALDVIDAIVLQGNAEVAHTQALADYRNAEAVIQNAIGTR